MKIKLQIILLLISLKSHGQTTISNVSLDSTGLLKWDLSFVRVDDKINISIQKQIGGNWQTISEPVPKMPWFYDNKKPETINFKDSCIIPADNGISNFRLIMTAPANLISKEVSINRITPNKIKQLFATENYIRFEKSTSFSIFDSNGNAIRKRDFDTAINVSSFKKGLYYITLNLCDIYEFEK